MERNVQNIIKAACIGAAGAVGGAAVSSMLSRELMRGAMDREESGLIKKQRESLRRDEVFSRFLECCEEAGERLLSRKSEKIKLTAEDGTELAAHLYRSKEEKRLLVCMHGWRSAYRLDFGLQADFLLSNGCTLLFPDERGQGESEGEYITFGILERADAAMWARYISERFPGVPIYLYGVSMGGTSVLLASELELPESTHGIIADCAYTSPSEIWEHIMKTRLHLSYALHKRDSERLCREKINADAEGVSTELALGRCRLPVLFIHGAADRIVPTEMSYRAFMACASEKRIFVVPGADHAMSWYTDREGYSGELSRFFADCERK